MAQDTIVNSSSAGATPINLTATGFSPISPLISQTSLRYPVCAVQGGSLIYSPLMGQPLFPWRPFSAMTSPTTPVSVSPNVNLLPPTTQATPTQSLSLAPLMQLSGYPYMAMLNSTGTTSKDSKDRLSVSPGKRDSSSSGPHSPEHVAKRPHLTVPDHTPLTTSTGVTKATSQRSPVIKLVNYTSSGVSGRGPSPPDSIQLQTIQSSQATPLFSMTQTSTEAAGHTVISNHVPSHLLPGNIVLVKCLGNLQDSSIAEQYNLKLSTSLQDIYSASLTAFSPPCSLSPETCFMLTLSYLNSLREGEELCLYTLRSLVQYTQSSETTWLQYYRKHKKMSESTFVQCQFVHFSRLSVYPSSKQVQVIVSQNSLVDGIGLAIQSLAKADPAQNPSVIAVLAVHQNQPIDFCLLIINSLLAKSIMEHQKITLNKGSPKILPTTNIVLSQDILVYIRRLHQKLAGQVYSPFKLPSLQEMITKEEASQTKVLPSHVVEHHAKGPFSEECNMALYLLQRILSSGQLEGYQRIDFFVICPNCPPLISQVILDISKSGLVQHFGLSNTGSDDDDIWSNIIKRVIPCHPHYIEDTVHIITSNPNILFIVIVKSAHATSRVTLHSVSGKGEIPYAASDCNELLGCHDNSILLYLSSHPYVLQTNRSFIPVSNEINWPVSTPTSTNEGTTSGMVFQSVVNVISTDRTADEGLATECSNGIAVREDNQFEKLVLESCNKERFSTPISTVRAQLLLSDYVRALVKSVNNRSHFTATPETQTMIDKLVQMPLANGRGHGIMVILRSHSEGLAKDIYCKIKAVRNLLGLEYRFDVLLDNGDNTLNLSDHFLKRLKIWGVGCHSNHRVGLSYEDLQNLPCLVVMTGRVLANVRMPQSFQYLDLRLIHSPSLTRSTYESDLSLLNRYQHPSTFPKPYLSSPAFSPKSRRQTISTCHSSISSCGSIDNHQSKRGIIEWKPPMETLSTEHAQYDNESHSPSSTKPQFEYHNTDMDCHDGVNGIHERGVAVVEIPQPVDQLANDVPDYNDIHEVEEMFFDSIDDVSDVDDDSETEDCDETSNQVVCLLSRQYYHIWKPSGIINRCLLLPPSEGVIGQVTQKRPPLIDPTHSSQSAYYRAWTKPEGKAHRVAMDTALREYTAGSKKRFLLSGPAHVGKFGSCLLFVCLLQDYLRSSQGIMAVNRPPAVLPVISSSSVAPSSMHSFVVPLEFLKQGLTLPSPVNSPVINLSNVVLTVSSSVAHNASHSCPKCSLNSPTERSSPITHTFTSILTFNTSAITIHWSIPTNKLTLVSIGTDQTLNYIKFSSEPTIFSLSLDQNGSALLNLSHTARNNLHVIVTKHSLLETYIQSWPNNIIVALPDDFINGLGSTLQCVKCLGQHLYERNVQEWGVSNVSPWILLCDDNVCMVQEKSEDQESSILLSDLLEVVSKSYQDYSAVSIPHWCNTNSSLHGNHTFSLDANFLLLNLLLTSQIHFNSLNYKSAVVDFHLRLLANNYRVIVPKKYSYVKKEVKPEKPVSPAELPPDIVSQPDCLVLSLHHDSSSLLDYSGPLLLETFLLYKSSSLFPSTQAPVLMIDNYINLGPQIYVALLSVEQLKNVQNVVFGGLVLYLCEGRLNSQMLHQLQFIPGACLLLITRDCKGLVKEVSRLDLEEKWQFKLRDEFQTACHDHMHPLFFLTGKYNLTM